ncbi:MAG: D-sedoheptulose 7-phosphate isomerase [Thermoanaerobaculaceae bacterium]|nr:D-sedoheptulose 7-phosphate isomerase [Thermoanaerobaculaceae bacterium]
MEISCVLENLTAIKESLLKDKRVLSEIAKTISSSFKKDGKLLVFGNGGSAADSQHFAAEIVGRYKKERQGFKAIALTTDTSVLTAVGNDYGFEKIFERQVLALGQKGDVAFGISTSGNSENVFLGLKAAKEKGMVTVALLGRDGGKISKMADKAIVYPYMDTPRIQEYHSICLHIIAYLIDEMTV